MGRNLLSLQHFLHTPNSLQLPLKTTPCCPLRHTHPILVPKGVLCTIGMSMWSTVFCSTQSAPCTLYQFMKSLHMHTGLSATFPWLVHHYVPTIHPFHQHFVNFPTPRHCHTCSESGHITAFGCSCPPCHPHPGVTPLQHWPRGPSFGRLAHSLEAHHHSPATPGNISLMPTCAPPSLVQSR